MQLVSVGFKNYQCVLHRCNPHTYNYVSKMPYAEKLKIILDKVPTDITICLSW